MASEFPSTVISKGPSWNGLESLEFLIVFGDSYSAVGYDHHSIPTREQPLGVEFPGTTFTDEGLPNWVGHLVTNYSLGSRLLVYDYAVCGARVYDVENQIQAVFKAHIAEKPAWAPWAAKNALFVTWVGINDSAWCSDHTDNMAKLFSAQQTLYDHGARNFLFINVPPIDRAPGDIPPRGRAPHFVSWNAELKKAAAAFAAAHVDATVMIYSSWDTFTALLDDPVAHGFLPRDVRKAGAAIWLDFLHPTSRVHDFIARDVSTFLSTCPARSASEEAK
ncbi:hypothetical protein GGX14DRAFT_373753 [Mycena pura]|uniref:SGNH hydrolase-type esterase domain-containing protein n=1 Tax=Mycena pura TaxID=153505 RepID=A0AAD6Y349_9AGAR|nr:hypothetical protein GGX14DRAFT_373753 [Mycena pura]